jgi:iron complex outermembrane receptor protein
MRKIIKIIILGMSLSPLSYTVQAVDIHTDKALDEELAYLHAENYVYSAGKKMQKINDVPAAVFVISQEDIHRSGATNVPDVLRMAPGIEVAQINANKWAITSRGFNDQFSFKLLVLIDGRTVYTPIFSGVYWHREDTPLEEVDRIEIIRGAGAAMWGSNAVNGVINIITKKAKATQGTLLSLGGGNQQAFASVRQGGKIGDAVDYRIYAKGFKRNNNLLMDHQNAHDDWESYQGGFKSEWAVNKEDTVFTQGDIFHSRTGDIENFPQSSAPFVVTQDSPAQHSGGNIQMSWKHKFSEISETALQLYYKHNDSIWNMPTPAKITERTFDIDFQHRFNLLERHDVMWGVNYRYFHFDSGSTYKLSFNPAQRNLQLFSGFLQDDITLFKDTLKLTMGTRLEHNDFTGFEIQPNIRLLWTPNTQHSIWGAVSRAVRTPSLSDTSNQFRVTIPDFSPTPAWVVVNGNPNFKSETVLDYEIGYRGQFTPDFSIDATAFYNNYDRIRIVKISPPTDFSKPYIELPLLYTNNAKGETMGLEITTQWQAADWLKMQASYSLLKENMVVLNKNPARRSPHQRFFFKAFLNLPFNLEIDPMVRYVDTDVTHAIPHYVAFDLRVAWSPMKNLEFSVVGQNLLDNAHLEYTDEAFEIPKTQIQRSVFGKISVSF